MICVCNHDILLSVLVGVLGIVLSFDLYVFGKGGKVVFIDRLVWYLRVVDSFFVLSGDTCVISH
jgi:hypothetical protein